jgi:hypothetical protein
MSLLTDASLLVTSNAYKEGKLYSIIPSNGNGDFTFTRATTATRVNSAGSVEVVPYNLAQYSEMFSDASWLKPNAILTPNTTIAPNGTLTADTLTGNGLTANSRIIQNITTLNATTYTHSIYAKKDTNDFVQLYGSNAVFGLDVWANFDLNNGVLGTVGALTTATITNVGNGWYRCTITGASIAASNSSTYIVHIIPSATTARAQSLAISTSVFIWGAQFVQNNSVLNYQMTEGRLNVPRIDYSLGSCPNILLEPQRSNILLQTNILATQTRIVTATTHTLSFYGTGTVTLSGVATGTLVGTGVNNRVTLTFTSTAGSLTLTVSGSVTLGQLEIGSYATSYIPTTTVSVTRNADITTRNNVYTNGLITASGGTWFIDLRNNLSLSITNGVITGGIFLNTGTVSNQNDGFLLRTGITATRMNINKVVAGTITVLYQLLTDNSKIAIKWNGATADVFVDGVKVVAATSFTTTAMENLITDGTNRSIQYNDMALFPTPLSDTQCIALTT